MLGVTGGLVLGWANWYAAGYSPPEGMFSHSSYFLPFLTYFKQYTIFFFVIIMEGKIKLIIKISGNKEMFACFYYLYLSVYSIVFF
mgnify:CR=1 FL=1